MTVADLEKILGGAYSLHLLPIATPFKLQWLQMYIIHMFHIDPQNKRQSIPHHIQNGKESFFFVLRVYEEVEVVPKV